MQQSRIEDFKQHLLEKYALTGIRVSEHRYITVEAVKAGKAEIRCK